MKLKRMRELKNLTQQNLAEILETSITNISHWESGNNIPQFKSIKMLQSFFGEGSLTKEDFKKREVKSNRRNS